MSLISSVGFPIFVALWFMFRLEKIITNNTAALIRVCEKLDDMGPEKE